MLAFMSSDVEGDVGEARMLVRHIHEYVLAAGSVDAVDDQVQLHAGGVLDDDHGVEFDLVLDPEAERRVERECPGPVGDANAKMVDFFNCDHGGLADWL